MLKKRHLEDQILKSDVGPEYSEGEEIAEKKDEKLSEARFRNQVVADRVLQHTQHKGCFQVKIPDACLLYS